MTQPPPHLHLPTLLEVETERLAQLTEDHFHAHCKKVWHRTDRMFVGLLISQWLVGIGLALWISPLTWIGATSSVHLHVLAAIFLGGLIAVVPASFAWLHPGQAITRHSVAAAQMLASALLIHLTGGRIETHFHIFGSLALLAFYRDWRVLVTASVVITVDHFFRGLYWPQSIFGSTAPEYFRWLEHAGWVAFEDVFLFIMCHQSIIEMRTIAHRQAQLELTNDRIELVVTDRTRQLEETNRSHQRTEQQLRWKTALFDAAVNSTLDGILVVDSDGSMVLQNHRMVDLWRLPQELIDDSNDQRRLDWVTKQIRNPQQFVDRVAYLYAHPDEVSRDELELLDGRYFDRYSAPVRSQDGTYYGRIWAFRDITNRKRADEQIAEQAALLNIAQDAILVADLDSKILFWNKGAERIYGWTEKEALGQKVSELMAANPGMLKTVIANLLAKGDYSGEVEHRTKDGRTLTVDAHRTLIRDRNGNPKSILAIYTNVTEKKKIEAQYMRAQRMESIGTLAGGIAHDLNNILSPIMMSIDLLKSTTADPQTTQILETIEISAQRGADIVRQVLSFARGLEGERIEVQPKHLLKDLESIIKDTFPKGIQLRFAVPADTWTILGDPTQVHQILLNLCVNARDALPHGGRLDVSVANCVIDDQYAAMHLQAEAGRYVNITVSDSGTGIPPAILDRIFEPFFTTKELSKGTGLGLSTVMAIVKSHEGFVTVYSEPGKGTTFKVYLPSVESSADVCSDESKSANLHQGNGETILVVDDEDSILIVTKRTLEEFGYQVLTATDGADAVAIYAEHRDQISVVLTDMMMPIMDGTAMTHALRRISPFVKVIAASGLNTNGHPEKVQTAGVKHFLTKPYTAGILLKTIRAILDEN